MKRNDPHRHAADALAQASAAARRGDLAAAQRWARTADQLSRAAERLAANPAPPAADFKADEELRAELRRRLARFVECDREIQAWDAEREAYEAALAAALANRTETPPPLRPCPAGPTDLERIARGED